MTAEITIRADGTVEMAYLDGVYCWHGLGNELQPGATIDDWKKAAGMDWRALRGRVRYPVSADPSVAMRVSPHQVVIFREDTGDELGIVSDGFNIVQPGATLEFFRDLVGAAGMQLQTAGTLFGGRKFWALAKVGEAAIIDPKNLVRANLLIATALDGSMATEAFYCSTVVVCNNTLRMARGEKGTKIKINHRSVFDPQAVKAELGIEAAQSVFERTISEMRVLAEKRMEERDVVTLTAELVKPGFAELAADEQAKIMRSKPVDTIGRLALDGGAIGSDLDGNKGTAWGWLNSVTEYVDHQARAKTADNRMDNAFFGKGAELKERAYAMAIDYTPSLADVISSTNAMMAEAKAKTSTGSALLDSVLAETVPL